jgi:hypothetical protein
VPTPRFPRLPPPLNRASATLSLTRGQTARSRSGPTATASRFPKAPSATSSSLLPASTVPVFMVTALLLPSSLPTAPPPRRPETSTMLPPTASPATPTGSRPRSVSLLTPPTPAVLPPLTLLDPVPALLPSVLLLRPAPCLEPPARPHPHLPPPSPSLLQARPLSPPSPHPALPRLPPSLRTRATRTLLHPPARRQRRPRMSCKQLALLTMSVESWHHGTMTSRCSTFKSRFSRLITSVENGMYD